MIPSDPARRRARAASAPPPRGTSRRTKARLARRSLAVLLASVAGAATAAPIACPATIVETPAVTSVWPGWAAEVRAGRRTLASAAVYVSHGSDRGGVAPDAAPRAPGHDEVSTWSLQPAEGDVYWVGCSYTQTSATLFQRVPETARRCRAAYESAPTGRRLLGRAVECE